jgi:hypothetical protein
MVPAGSGQPVWPQQLATVETLIIPAIIPFRVTGAVTATGGARNASIVAEVASCGQNRGVCGSANCAGNALCAW